MLEESVKKGYMKYAKNGAIIGGVAMQVFYFYCLATNPDLRETINNEPAQAVGRYFATIAFGLADGCFFGVSTKYIINNFVEIKNESSPH